MITCLCRGVCLFVCFLKGVHSFGNICVWDWNHFAVYCLEVQCLTECAADSQWRSFTMQNYLCKTFLTETHVSEVHPWLLLLSPLFLKCMAVGDFSTFDLHWDGVAHPGSSFGSSNPGTPPVYLTKNNRVQQNRLVFFPIWAFSLHVVQENTHPDVSEFHPPESWPEWTSFFTSLSPWGSRVSRCVFPFDV